MCSKGENIGVACTDVGPWTTAMTTEPGSQLRPASISTIQSDSLPRAALRESEWHSPSFPPTPLHTLVSSGAYVPDILNEPECIPRILLSHIKEPEGKRARFSIISSLLVAANTSMTTRPSLGLDWCHWLRVGGGG